MEHKSTPFLHVNDMLFNGGWHEGLMEDTAGVCMLGTLRMIKKESMKCI